MRKIGLTFTVTLLFPLFFYGTKLPKTIVPVNLRTEYLYEPIGIDTEKPRFTWEYEGQEKDFIPVRTEVRIGTAPNKLSVYSENMSFQPHTRYYWNVRVWDRAGKQSKVSETASFETGKFDIDDWAGTWITDKHDKEYEPSPLFRKKFTADKKIKDARIYIAAAGYYEMYLNGKRVGQNYLDPGYTQFDKRILYVTHDVTPLLKHGENVVATVLGNGWFNEQSAAGVWNFHNASWRARPAMLCEMRITYTNGTSEVISTDESWRTATGPYIYNNIYAGDKYDATIEQTGWNDLNFDDSGWQSALAVANPTQLLVSQQMPAIQITEELAPVDVKAFDDTTYLFSFDRNISGLIRLKIKGERGTRIVMKHGERLDKNGRLTQEPINEFFNPDIKGGMFQTDVYTLKGTDEEEIYIPSFTYHGFQYVEVECSKPITLSRENLTALFIHTNLEPTGRFTCSDPLLNKIWDATMNAYLSNLHSIPTDCPQREKNGWTADAHISVDLGLLGFDGITVYEKWMNDFIDNQREAGDITGIIPSYDWGYGIGPVWDAALFIIPNALYDYYGDKRCIENLYPTMLRYLDFLKSREVDGMINFGLGDWVPWKAQTNNEFTSSGYYYLDHVLMARFATLLGKDATPFQQKADDLKQRINDKFFNPEKNTYAEGTQAAQAVALYLGLVPRDKEQPVADKLHALVEANDYFLDFGMLGSKTVPAMLAKYGHISDVMKMLTKTEAPSWGNWIVVKRYKTLPEDWGGVSSLNHVFLGDISAWMMNWLAGIRHDSTAPGFRQINITPHFVKELDWVKGEYHSVKGLISSEWKRENGNITLSVDIPIGTDATIEADGHTHHVKGGIHKFTFKE